VEWRLCLLGGGGDSGCKSSGSSGSSSSSKHHASSRGGNAHDAAAAVIAGLEGLAVGGGGGGGGGGGSGSIPAAAACNTSLQRLVIDDAFLSDAGLEEGLAVLPNLRCLELCACHWLGGGGLAGARACPRLRTLALTQCNGIDEVGLALLPQTAKGLARLEVVRCSRLRPATLAALQAAFAAANGRLLEVAYLSV